MKAIKVGTAIILAIILTVAFVACGEDDVKSDGKTVSAQIWSSELSAENIQSARYFASADFADGGGMFAGVTVDDGIKRLEWYYNKKSEDGSGTVEKIVVADCYCVSTQEGVEVYSKSSDAVSFINIGGVAMTNFQFFIDLFQSRLNRFIEQAVSFDNVTFDSTLGAYVYSDDQKTVTVYFENEKLSVIEIVQEDTIKLKMQYVFNNVEQLVFENSDEYTFHKIIKDNN